MYLSNLPKNIRALITTRDPTVFPEEYVFKLPPFNKKESLDYLKENLLDYFSDDQLEKLIAEVGDKYGNTTPYHMNKVVAWFKEKRFEATIDGYIKDMRTYKAEGEEEPETKMLLDFLNQSENNAESWKLLQYVSYLDPEFIDAQILAKLLDLDGLGGLTNAVDPLLKLSLIDEVKNDSGQRGIASHRLVQKTTKSYITKHKDNPKVPTLTNEEIQEKLIKTLNDLMPTVDRSPEKWDEAARSYKHVEKLLKEIDFDNPPSEDKTVLKELSSLLRKVGSYNLYVTSTYKQSLEYYKQALQLDKAIYGKNHPSVAISYNDLGLTYAQLGEHEKAFECIKKGLQIRIGVLEENHPDVATSYNDLAFVYVRLGEDEKALEYLEKALQIRQVLPENKYLAISFNNIGYIYGRLGEDEKALEYKKKALEVFLQVLEENHPDIAICCNNVGLTYGQLGKHEKSLEYHEKALGIFMKVLPENHPFIATSYGYLGVTYEQLKEHEKALEYQEKALKIRLEVLPENHPDVATSLKKVSDNYGKLGNYKEALHYGELALKMFQELGDESMVASCFNNLGVTYGKVRDNEKAIEYELKSLEIREKLYPGTEVLANTLSNISATYRKLKTYEEALEYELKALEIKETLYPGTEIVATTLGNVGYIYSRLKKHEYALKYELKALDIRQKLYPNNDNKLLADISNNVGYTYDQLGKHKEALKYYKQSYKILDSLENRADFAKYMQNIESKIVVLEGGDLKIQDNADSAVSSVDSIIPDDDSAKDDSDADILGEVATE